MKKRTILPLLFTILLPNLLTAQTPSLPDGSEAQKRYSANHLRVQQTHPEADKTSYNSYRWVAFHGTRRLSEVEFFNIAGRPDLALEAERRDENLQRQRDGVLPRLALGVGAVVAGLIMTDIATNEDQEALGKTVSITGGLMAVMGVLNTPTDNPLPNSSFETAIQVAHEFNDRLMMALLLESQQDTSGSSPQEVQVDSVAVPEP